MLLFAHTEILSGTFHIIFLAPKTTRYQSFLLKNISKVRKSDVLFLQNEALILTTPLQNKVAVSIAKSTYLFTSCNFKMESSNIDNMNQRFFKIFISI